MFKRPDRFSDGGGFNKPAGPSAWAEGVEDETTAAAKTAVVPQRELKRPGGFVDSQAGVKERPDASDAKPSKTAAAAPLPKRNFLRGDGGRDEGDLDDDGAIPTPEVSPAPADLPATRAARRQAMRDFKRRNQALDGDSDESDIDVEEMEPSTSNRPQSLVAGSSKAKPTKQSRAWG